MTKRRFGKRSGFAAVLAVALVAALSAWAQQGVPVSKPGKRVATFQLTSEPRRLPPPNGLCNLETGPETFQLITQNDAQAKQLKHFVGKEISVKVGEIACAQDVGQMSEAIITKWSVVTK
jgi:hypothetical protein